MKYTSCVMSEHLNILKLTKKDCNADVLFDW